MVEGATTLEIKPQCQPTLGFMILQHFAAARLKAYVTKCDSTHSQSNQHDRCWCPGTYLVPGHQQPSWWCWLIPVYQEYLWPHSRQCAFDSLTFDTFTFLIKLSALTFQSQHGTMIYHIIEVHYTYLAPYTGCHFLLSIPDTITVYNTIIWPNTVWHPGAGLGYLIPRLLHSLSLVALGLLVGYETWSPIGCHHPFVINWSKYRLGLPRSQWNMGSRETGGHFNFSEATDSPLAQPLWQATACR